MTLLLFCIGILVVEGDEHKHQVRFFVSGFVRTVISYYN